MQGTYLPSLPPRSPGLLLYGAADQGMRSDTHQRWCSMRTDLGESTGLHAKAGLALLIPAHCAVAVTVLRISCSTATYTLGFALYLLALHVPAVIMLSCPSLSSQLVYS